MSALELDAIIDRLLPQVLADRALGNGRTFTRLHLSHLWALSCLHAGECYDQTLLVQRVQHYLPAQVLIAQDLAT